MRNQPSASGPKPKPEVLQRLREITGKGQYWLAKVTGIDRSKISLIENGHIAPSPNELSAMVAALCAAELEVKAEFDRVSKEIDEEILGDQSEHEHAAVVLTRDDRALPEPPEPEVPALLTPEKAARFLNVGVATMVKLDIPYVSLRPGKDGSRPDIRNRRYRRQDVERFLQEGAIA